MHEKFAAIDLSEPTFWFSTTAAVPPDESILIAMDSGIRAIIGMMNGNCRFHARRLEKFRICLLKAGAKSGELRKSLLCGAAKLVTMSVA